MIVDKIVPQIEKAIINRQHIHPSEEQRVARIFFKEIQENGWYGLDEVSLVIRTLTSEFSYYWLKRIEEIAQIIQLLGDQSRPGKQ